MNINNLTGEITGAAVEVHKALDPGLLESVYEECLGREFDLRQRHFKRQQAISDVILAYRCLPAIANRSGEAGGSPDRLKRNLCALASVVKIS
jgi:hypothetical protein